MEELKDSMVQIHKLSPCQLRQGSLVRGEREGEYGTLVFWRDAIPQPPHEINLQ